MSPGLRTGALKILFTSRFCQLGGAETFMLGLASALRSYGHHCELFFFQHGPFERHLPADCVAHFGTLADCMRLVQERRFDVVHARSSDWPTGISAVRRLGAKLVITSHGFVALGWNSANCDAFAGCAKWLTDEQQAVTDVPVQAVLNGIDTSQFAPAEPTEATSPPIVAWVGRGIEPRKRIDRFAAIGRLLAKAGLRLWVVDPYGPAAVAKVIPSAQALVPVVDLWRAVPVERMPSLYQEVAASGGCVVSTASWEGLPLTLLEAQACGCPVIGPDVRGTNECVVPAHGGVLYPFDMHADKLAALVLETLRKTDEMKWRRSACARYVRQQFGLDRMAQDYLRIYQEAPYRRRGTYMAGVRARRRLSPLRHWDDYVAHRWVVGHRQYDLSEEFAQRGEWQLAKAMARDALVTSPTIYVRPKRIALLLKTHLYSTTE